MTEARLPKSAAKKRAVVAGANDEHVLEAVFAAQDMGYVSAVLIGQEEAVWKTLTDLGLGTKDCEILDIAPEENPSARAVERIRAGGGDFIIKGKMETRDLLKPVLNKETGLNSQGFVTHFGYMQIHDYHKMLAMSDAAVIPHPTLEEKAKILRAGLAALGKLGYDNPVVGALCAVEGVNESMPETLDAARLQEMAEAGDFGDCTLLGPISYDLATSKESVEIKGYDKKGAGDADFLLLPELVTGNVMSKIWNNDPRNSLAGCLVGTDVPIVLTSRSASAQEKLNSILLCAALSDG